jgi:hypothetical protein
MLRENIRDLIYGGIVSFGKAIGIVYVINLVVKYVMFDLLAIRYGSGFGYGFEETYELFKGKYTIMFLGILFGVFFIGEVKDIICQRKED